MPHNDPNVPPGRVVATTVGGPLPNQRIAVLPGRVVLVVESQLVATAFTNVPEPHYRLDGDTERLVWVSSSHS